MMRGSEMGKYNITYTFDVLCNNDKKSNRRLGLAFAGAMSLRSRMPVVSLKLINPIAKRLRNFQGLSQSIVETQSKQLARMHPVTVTLSLCLSRLFCGNGYVWLDCLHAIRFKPLERKRM
jgi:hypothetical protein